MSTPEQLALAAASQASNATAELIRFAYEGPNHPRPFGDVEVVELLADGLKLAIETEMAAEVDERQDEERDQLLAALAKFLDGWA